MSPDGKRLLCLRLIDWILTIRREVFRYKLDPNSVFLEAVLDPRMQDAEAKKWKERLQDAGFTNRIIQSGLYKPPEQVVLKVG